MTNQAMGRAVEILLVEDNPGDVELVRMALGENKISNNLHVAEDGGQAMVFLRREAEYADTPRPDLILLDLNLPVMDGRKVLSEIKEDDDLKCIPVVILTSSKAEEDVNKSYALHANCYITKPVQLEQFVEIVRSIKYFWFTIVKLPDYRMDW